MMGTLNKLIAYARDTIVGLGIIVGVIVAVTAAALLFVGVTVAVNVGVILMVGVIAINNKLTRV